VFLSLFGSCSQWAITPSVVALQDPPVYWGKLPSFQLYACFSPPSESAVKPCVAFYVFSTFPSTITLLPKSFGRNDIMALNLFTPEGFFDPSMVAFTIVNSYSTKGRSNNTRSVPANLVFPDLAGPVLTLGDLNIHHLTADPLRTFSEDELATSTPYFDKVRDLGYSLLNTPGIYTRFSMSLVGRLDVIELAFACPLLAPCFTEWSDRLPSTGSDHIPILLRFEGPFFRATPRTPKWPLTHWGPVDTALKSLVVPPSPPGRPLSRLGLGLTPISAGSPVCWLFTPHSSASCTGLSPGGRRPCPCSENPTIVP